MSGAWPVAGYQGAPSRWPDPLQTCCAGRARTGYQRNGRTRRAKEFVIGVGPHSTSHTAALDWNGRTLEALRVNNAEEGLQALRRWGEQRFDGRRRWTVEGVTNPFAAPWVAGLVIESRMREKHSPFGGARETEPGTKLFS